jgi:hypothetical protein
MGCASFWAMFSHTLQVTLIIQDPSAKNPPPNYDDANLQTNWLETLNENLVHNFPPFFFF